MNILTVVESKHQGNTLKIAQAMSKAVPMTVTDAKSLAGYDLKHYDIIGFGSGIYYGRYDKDLMEAVKSLGSEKAFCFVFSTSGMGSIKEENDPLIALLDQKGKTVLGSFSCRGHDKFLLFRIIGGLNKGHPDEQDAKNARDFILGIVEKYNNMKKEL